ncbi:MAG: 5-methyltetrahydropteroyltriglutamate--homocysteine S-methyltransferase [Desulfovibrio aminophilus]|uniref:5-methyltetrahydropteroyltriglutamate-- homocysteine S-methyltransferase n=1 Tax=Desulfovibrio aminophilus TaxID=81425 RepID=UPI0039E9CA26
MLTQTLGFPRIGRDRELKRAVEGYWKGEVDREALAATAAALRAEHWRMQREAGVDLLPVGDFALYDQMLDLSLMLGCVPERYAGRGEPGLETMFLMARGGVGVGAMEMTKWFDTNYHYIVPELAAGQAFRPSAGRLAGELREAARAGYAAKAVLPGPFTFLALAKTAAPGLDKWSLLEPLTEAYEALLREIGRECGWLQIDEPVLVMGLPGTVRDRFRPVLERLRGAAGKARLMLATYFGGVAAQADLLDGLAADCLHLDLVRAPEQLEPMAKRLPKACALSLGLVDGRNVWRTDLARALDLGRKAVELLGLERLMVAPSCSLLHTPVDLAAETALDPEVREWMAFAVQKCGELRLLADALAGRDVMDALAGNTRIMERRRSCAKAVNPAVCDRAAAVTPEMTARRSPYSVRNEEQRTRLDLPELPTTTIGSFPQTTEVRAARAAFKAGKLDRMGYEQAMTGFIRRAVEAQEAAGLDVLVHGEPERNDMVEYFGEQLDGFCFTKNGWVQSYGTRCVKPPVIYGDVSRPRAMTVEWWKRAAAMTKKPMKGMLTGPVTILCWSFVRDDQPRSATCRQIALAIRDEVADLERAGAPMVQIDEPALREGLPLEPENRGEYLDWAVECFRLASTGVSDATQIHTHMCYAEFNEIIEWIAAMDADVISIEAGRSGMELLEAFGRFHYPNEVGPGVWDIHSPRVPGVEEMVGLLEKALRVIPRERLWVNPDCGLKTRDWPETEASMRNMVEAARKLRRPKA